MLGWITTMLLKSCMVTERKMRHYADSRKLAAKVTGILNFITMLLCLLMDMLDMPSEIRIYRNQGPVKLSSGTRAFLYLPAFFTLKH